MRVHVRGKGVIGRLVGRACVHAGFDVTGSDDGSIGASSVAAGLLSPLSGHERPSASLVDRARRSLERWPDILKGTNVAFARTGSVAVALDGAELDDLERMLTSAGVRVERSACARFSTALCLPDDGWIDARAALDALDVPRGEGGDVTIDCRGLGARDVLPLRGVRGELLWVEAPHVTITRPVRLVGRDPVYVVPRPNGRYVIGATCIESDSSAPITVGATIDLLAGACAIHPGFREARVLEQHVGVRPALVDHEPCIRWIDRTLYVNGLFRHGFVIGPALADEVVEELRRCA